MALTHQKFKAIIEIISKENDIPEDKLFSQIADLYQPSSLWGSKSAKDLALKKKIDIKNISGSGSDGKILLADVQKAAGMKVEVKEKLGPFVSQKAKCLAKKCGLFPDTKKHFPMKMRSGINKKTGKKEKITLANVRSVAGTGKNDEIIVFASKQAAELAKKHGFKQTSIEGTGINGKIKKTDIEYFLKQKKRTSKSDEEEVDEVESDKEEVDEVESDSEDNNEN